MNNALRVCLIFALVSCGSTGSPMQEPPDNGPEPPDEHAGRLFLLNNTMYVIEATYLNEVDPAQPQIIRSQVGPGERRDIGQALLPGGWAFALDVVIVVPAQDGFRVRRKAQISIDGEQLVQVHLEDPQDPFSVQLAVQ